MLTIETIAVKEVVAAKGRGTPPTALTRILAFLSCLSHCNTNCNKNPHNEETTERLPQKIRGRHRCTSGNKREIHHEKQKQQGYDDFQPSAEQRLSRHSSKDNHEEEDTEK